MTDDIQHKAFWGEPEPPKTVMQRLTEAVNNYLLTSPPEARHLHFELTEKEYLEFMKEVHIMVQQEGNTIADHDWRIKPQNFIGPHGVRVTIKVKSE